MTIRIERNYLDFIKLLHDEDNDVTLITKKDIGTFPKESKFKPVKIIFNEAIYIVSEDTGDLLYLPLDFKSMDNINNTFEIHTKVSSSLRNYFEVTKEEPEKLKLNDIQEDFLRDYTYIIRTVRNVEDKFIKGKEYHVIQENHSKNEHLIFVINEKGIKQSISCTREDFENPESLINNFDLYKRKGSHKVEITDTETSIEEELRRLRQDKEDLLRDIIEYPRDYKIVCKVSVPNEFYDTEDCIDQEPFDFIAGRVYFGDLDELEEGSLELIDEMTRVNGLKHTVIAEEEEFFDEDSWFNRHFEIVER